MESLDLVCPSAVRVGDGSVFGAAVVVASSRCLATCACSICSGVERCPRAQCAQGESGNSNALVGGSRGAGGSGWSAVRSIRTTLRPASGDLVAVLADAPCCSCSSFSLGWFVVTTPRFRAAADNFRRVTEFGPHPRAADPSPAGGRGEVRHGAVPNLRADFFSDESRENAPGVSWVRCQSQ